MDLQIAKLMDLSNFILESGLSYFRVLITCLMCVYFVSAAGCHCFDFGVQLKLHNLPMKLLRTLPHVLSNTNFPTCFLTNVDMTRGVDSIPCSVSQKATRLFKNNLKNLIN